MIVNSNGSISGTGWIGSNLTLDGKLIVDTIGPLQIAGAADLTGSTFQLPAGYSQVGSLSAPLTILKAEAGITGQFINLQNSSLGSGFTLHSIVYDTNSVTIQVSSAVLPGDYNRDFVVDAADYVVWRKTLNQVGPGLLADGNGTNSVNAADYTVWRQGFSSSAQGGGSNAAAPVPEPHATLCVVLAVLAGACAPVRVLR